MFKIENKNLSSSLGLLQNVPTAIANKIINKLFLKETAEEEIEVIIISGEAEEVLSAEIAEIGGKYENLGFGFGIVKIAINKIVDLARLKNIQYIEIPKSLYTTDSESNRASCVPQMQDSLNLYGEGVLVGFIDTGIDYTHNAFRNEDGTTRIEYIYDLIGDGVVYSKEQINEALRSPNPYSIVNTPDLSKHGTHVAGIACAGGNIPKQYYGVAPKSSIIMVKTTRGIFSLSTQIMRGLKFLVEKSKELGKPLVVNISMSTNDGAHNGLSLLEQYIETIARLERITIVIAAGNEGSAAHHVGGVLSGNVERFVNVGVDESNVIINLYKSILPEASLTITSPDGVSSGEINLVEGFKNGVLGNSFYSVFVSGPKPFDVIGEISIALTAVERYITIGRWKITLKAREPYVGIYDMWLPISEGLNTSTKFFEPTVTNTLGIPATVDNVISVGSYNYITNTISPFSGRGIKRERGPIKPDLVAPGEDIMSTISNNRFDKKSGTSMATPHVTGICALFLEWGIVKGNDFYLYGERLKYFLINKAKRERFDVEYPDSAWGFGTVCAYDSFKYLRDILISLSLRESNISEKQSFLEFKKGNLFIKKPL